MIIQRQTQQIFPGKWPELEAINKKFGVVEARLGFPANQRYICMIGGHDYKTLIVEHQWESMAAMEEAFNKAFMDPEHQALVEELEFIIKSNQIELLQPLL